MQLQSSVDVDHGIIFRTEAKIWDLYLEDAERAAKEKVELVKSGLLDSVLIFVRNPVLDDSS